MSANQEQYDLEILTVAVYPRLGGMTAWFDQIARGLSSRGWKVRVVGFAEEGSSPPATAYDTVRIPATAVGSIPFAPLDKWIRWKGIGARAGTLFADRYPPRLLLSDSTPGVLRLARQAAARAHIPWAVLAGGDVFRETEGKPWSPLLHRRIRADLRAAHRILVDGPDLVESLNRRGIPEDRFEIAYHGVDPERFSPSPTREGKSPFRLVWHGRLADHHGPLRFLDLAGRIEGVEAFLCGAGPEEDPVRQWLASRGIEDRFAGRLPEEELGPFLGRADCGVYPLRNMAGVPTVVLEAMAVGLPCVVSEVGAVGEAIVTGRNGFVCRDEDEMVEHIETLRDRPDLCRHIGQAAAQTITDHWSLEAAVSKLEKILEEIRLP